MYRYHRRIVPKLVLNENCIPIVRSQMRAELKIHCRAIYSGAGCVKCERDCMPKSMIATCSFSCFTVSFLLKYIANKKRKFVDSLEQSLSQTCLCAISKFVDRFTVN